MKDSHARSLAKAISWRIFGTFSTMVIAYLFTHQWNLTFYIGVFEFVSKIGLFYVHERLWGRVHTNIKLNFDHLKVSQK